MKFSICNEFCENWKLDDVFKLAAEIGYDGVEIAPFTLADSVDDIPPDERERIKKSAAEHGVEIVGLHWLLVSPEGLYINHPDEDLRNKTKDYVKKLINFCGDLGGKAMVIGSPKQRNILEGKTYEWTWNVTKEVFSECADVARTRDVTLCIEPLAKTETNFINTGDDAVKLAQEINHPNFKIILDVKAMSDEGKPMDEIIEGAGDWIAHFHANDENLRGPGFGDTDFTPIAAALKRINYKGYVSVEVFDFKPDPETIAVKSYEYMMKVFE